VAVTELTEPEQALWQAFPRGAWVDLRDGDRDRAIRAEVIRALLLGAADREPGHAPGVRIRGARITGRLDLMGATVAWLVLLLAADSIMFALAPPPPLIASQAPHFNPVVYTLDLLLPVVDLGQKHAFNPAGAEQWFSYLLVAAGWILVSTVAAGAARVLTRR
jgi:hypothetical protein